MEKQPLQPDSIPKLNKKTTNPLVNTTLFFSLVANPIGCGDRIEGKDATPLDANQKKIESALAQEKNVKQINNAISYLLEKEETQKKGMQIANRYPHQVNEEVVKKIIEIAEEERAEKKPEKRSSLIITALGNLTIERHGAKEEEREEYIQIKNNIVACLADILKEEYKEHLLEDKITEEAQKNDRYKGKVRKAIYQAYGRISTNPEFIKNDFENLKKLLNNFDPKLNAWVEEKLKSYEMHKSTILEEQQKVEKEQE